MPSRSGKLARLKDGCLGDVCRCLHTLETISGNTLYCFDLSHTASSAILRLLPALSLLSGDIPARDAKHFVEFTRRMPYANFDKDVMYGHLRSVQRPAEAHV